MKGKDDNDDDIKFESIVRTVLKNNQKAKSSNFENEDDQEYAFLLAEYVMECVSNEKSNLQIAKSLETMGESKEMIERIIQSITVEKISIENCASSSSVTDKTEVNESLSTPSQNQNERIRTARSRLSEILDKKYPEIKDRSWGLNLRNSELGSRICILLDEPKEEKMVRAIDRMGNVLAVEILRETLSLEEIGGLKVKSGERRRTSGGVFWKLLYSRMTKEDKKYVTLKERERKNRKRNADKSQFTNRTLQNRPQQQRFHRRQEQYKRTHCRDHYDDRTKRRRGHNLSRQRNNRHRNYMDRRREKNRLEN